MQDTNIRSEMYDMVKIRYNVLQIEIFKTSLKLYWKSSDPRVLNECTQPCFVQLAFKQTLLKSFI